MSRWGEGAAWTLQLRDWSNGGDSGALDCADGVTVIRDADYGLRSTRVSGRLWALAAPSVTLLSFCAARIAVHSYSLRACDYIESVIEQQAPEQLAR